MKTIIFFYQSRALREPLIEVSTEGKTETAGQPGREYLLIRVGFHLEGEEWFGQNVGQDAKEEEGRLLEMQGEEMQEEEMQEEEPPFRTGPFGALRRARYRKREAVRKETAGRKLEELLSARERQRKAAESDMRRVAERILDRAGEENESRYVCEDCLRECPAWKVWLSCFPVEEFDGYLEAFWAEWLLRRAVRGQFVILGVCGGIFGLIESCADRMKGLRWILRERDRTPELEDFVEGFCGEYGVAIALQTVSGQRAYRRLKLSCPEPTNILDFSGENGISARDVAPGSVWLDMLSSEEKRRRLTGRETGIGYYSLKTEWRGRKGQTRDG